MPRSGLQLNAIEFKDGTKLTLNPDSILVVTGPNNCGKSQFLKDLFYISRENIVLKSAHYQQVGDKAEILKDILKNQNIRGAEQHLAQAYGANGGNISILSQSVAGNQAWLNAVLQGSMRYLTTINRLFSIQTTPGDDPGVPFNPYTLPFQLKRLFEDRSFEDAFYSKVKSAFGKGALIDRYSFQINILHYVDAIELDARKDKGSPSFCDWFSNQPLLDSQGDGIKSFCSVLLAVMESEKPLVLIDEPESFLHPPQVRRLAWEIAKTAPTNTQLVISTHSTEFLQSIIDFAHKRTSVIRLTRQTSRSSDINTVSRSSSEDISLFWRDPQLRTSDAFTSLFHDVAVLVEGDSDARFFRSLLDQISGPIKDLQVDVRFYHCGGKQKIYKIASALKSIGVPVIAVVDIDVLNDRGVFKNIAETFGLNNDSIWSKFEKLQKFILEQKSVRNVGDARLEIGKILGDLDASRPIPANALTKINEVLQASSAWRLAKRSGLEFFTRGEPYNAFVGLAAECEENGLFINRLGELENFDKTIEARKEEWLSKVYEKNLATDDALHEARIFIERMLKHAASCTKKLAA